MRATPVVLLLLGLIPAGAAAQGRHWQLVAEVGMTRFSTALTDTAPPPLEITAWRPRMYTLRLLHEGEKLGWGVGVSVANVGFGAGEGTGILVVFEDQYTLVEVAPELRYRLLTTSRGAQVLAHAGPVLDQWLADGTDTRSIWGAQGGLSLALPITSWLGVDLRTDWTYTGNFVTEEDAGADGVREDAIWRGRFGIGVAFGL